MDVLPVGSPSAILDASVVKIDDVGSGENRLPG